MTIVLYNVTDDAKTIGKVLGTPLATLTGTLRDSCSIIDPVITIGSGTQASSVVQCNYMYIADFNRYYFVRNIKFVHNCYELSAHVDVLESFKDEIKDITCIIERSASLYNNKYVDKQLITSNPKRKFQKKFTTPSEMSNEQMVMVILGKSNTGGNST